MDNHNKSPDGSPNRATAASVRDGLIDFSTYSTAQLNDLQHGINRETHPQDFRNLVKELTGRESRSLDFTADDREYSVRFTSRGGILGWLQSRYRRSSLYGPGVLRFETDDVVLRGWQRTWLGVPLQAEIRIDSRHIRNAVLDGRWVRFQSRPDGTRRRQFQCEAAEEETAGVILQQLPTNRTAGFDAEWIQLRDFDQALQLASPRAWATPILIALNILVFLGLAFSGAGFWIADLQALTRWGSNLGLLTIDGQWWRLLSALFLHVGFLHLALNMWVLWGVGRLVERLYGTSVFLFVYFCSGILASLSSVAWDPSKNSVGASGAIFGIFGAYLVFLMRRGTRVPARIALAQGLSTAAFVLFNLINGMMRTNIDNAAHVGGLLGGCLLGWILVRPLNPEERVRLTAMQMTLACLVACVAIGAGFWQIHELRASRSAPERYWVAHQWLLTGETRMLRAQDEMMLRNNAGNLSGSELTNRFERDVLPFWEDADARLLDEPESSDPEMSQFAAIVAEFVRLHREAALALMDTIHNHDQSRMIDVGDYSRQAEQAAARVTRLETRARANRRDSLSESRYAKAVRNVLTRWQWECFMYPEVTAQVRAEPSTSDGKSGRIAAGCAAQRAFATGDYESLDSMLHPAKDGLADLEDGGSRLSGVVGGLDDFLGRGPTLDNVYSRLADWRRARPASDGPDLVEAVLLRSWAWSARGSGSVQSVSPQQWAWYAQRIEMATAALEDAEKKQEPSPVRYQMALQLGVDQGTHQSELRPVFDTGIAKFPGYEPLYAGMLRALLPRWGGSYGDVDNFIESIVRQIPSAQGAEMYARLYSAFASMEGDETDVFKDAHAKWPTIKRGYEDMLRRYPKSASIRNAYAAFACRAKDAETYRAARASVAARVLKTEWTEEYSPQKCDESLL